jgi:hypothetical protein
VVLLMSLVLSGCPCGGLESNGTDEDSVRHRANRRIIRSNRRR